MIGTTIKQSTAGTQQQGAGITIDPRLASFAHTDAGNAEAFLYLHEDNVRFDHRRKRWLLWDPPLWREDPNAKIERMALEVVRLRQASAILHLGNQHDKKEAIEWAIQSESHYRISALLKFVSTMMPVATDGSGWDENDWILGCENGVVDLHAGKLQQGCQGDMLTISTGLLYDPSAKCPRWDQFLQEVFCGDADLIDFVQRAFGYSLTGSTTEEVVFLLYGTGANGKSKFVNRLRDILGDYSWNVPFSTFELLERAGSATNEIAEMAGMRTVTASETRESGSFNEARLKALTGGEDITARFLYSRSFRFRPRLKIWLSVNHKPAVKDDSYGFWRRMRLIPFLVKFSGKQQDKMLEQKLHAEAPGVLAWAVRGAVAWQKQGLEAPPSVVKATNQYQEENDEIAEFIRLFCVTGKNKKAYAADLYQEYCGFSTELGEKPQSGKWLGLRLGEKGFTKTRDTINGRVVYEGIGIAAGFIPGSP